MIGQELLSNGMGVSQEALGAVTGGFVAVTSLFKSIKRIPEGQMGIRTSFGKVRRKNGQPIIEGPGLRWVMPFTHAIETIDVRDQSTDVNELFVDRDEQYRILASFRWRVSAEDDNPYRAFFLAEGIEKIVPNVCTAGLRTVMTEISKDKMEDEPAVHAQVNELCSADLAEYGVELRRVNLHSVARSIGEMLRPLGDGQPPSTGALALAGDAMPGLAVV